jgi:hypothetical protein
MRSVTFHNPVKNHSEVEKEELCIIEQSSASGLRNQHFSLDFPPRVKSALSPGFCWDLKKFSGI